MRASSGRERERVALPCAPHCGVRNVDKDLYETQVRLVKTIKISEAKRNFTKVFARAKRGETVILQNGNDYVQLLPWISPEPIPARPAGYFAADEETAAMRNTLGEESGPVR